MGTGRNGDPGKPFERDYSQEPRKTGHVEQKGYGFIERQGGPDVFVHFSNINRQPQTLKQHDRVSFVVMPGKKGPEARDVKVIAEALD